VESSSQAKLRRAHLNVRRTCEMLLSPTPEILDQCSVLLETTSRDLAGCRLQRDGGAAALPEALQLRAAVRHARVLLDQALSFHQGWTRRLGAITGGYTATGEPAAVNRGSRLAVRG
jgi:hypothetical protein